MNFKAVQDQVMAVGGYGEVERTFVKAWINEARRDVLTRFPWSWLEKTATISTVANTETVTLPTDLFLWGRLVPGSASTQRLDYVDMEDPRSFAITRAYNDTGVPRYYSIFEGKLWFFPKPDAVYTYSARYWKDLTTDLSADGDATGLPAHDDGVLVSGALYHGALYSRNRGLAAMYQDQYEGKLGQMIRNEKLRQRETTKRAAMPDQYAGMFDDA